MVSLFDTISTKDLINNLLLRRLLELDVHLETEEGILLSMHLGLNHKELDLNIDFRIIIRRAF